MIAKHAIVPDFHFRVLVEELADGSFRATCLDWDIVAEEPTEKKTLEQLYRLMDLQWRTAVEHGAPDSVWHPAPKQLWEKFYSSLKYLKPKSIPKPQKHSDVVYA